MKGFSFIKKLLFLFIMGVGIVSLSSYSTYMDYSIDDSISSTDSPQQDPPTTLSNSGSAAGYDFVKPFVSTNLGSFGYVGSDGYMYTGGYSWGGSSSGAGSWYKQTNAGTNIVDYEIAQNNGIMVNSSGTVKRAAANSNTTATWSNVTVGGSTTSGKAVSMGVYYQMVLTNTDVLYVSEDGATSMTSIVSSAATSSSRGGIVDFAVRNTYQFVLYGNGDLYRGLDGALEASMTKVASNVLMFDFDQYNVDTYIYIYNSSNQIQYGAVASVTATSGWTTLVTVADVVQIRGSYYSSSSWCAGWGYLTSDGTLKTYESGTGISTSLTRTVTGVDYFDNSTGSWGYLKGGKMYLWTVGNSYVSTNTSPSTLSAMTNATNNSFDIADLAGTDRDLQNTPPA